MIENKYGKCFLVVGKTQDVDEVGSGFKRYIGVASCSVLAVNPTKEEADKIMGYDTKAPEYVKDGENGKEAKVTFIIETTVTKPNPEDPKTPVKTNVKNFLSFTLRNAENLSQKGSVQVIDKYGNSTWAAKEDADNGKMLPVNYKIDQYHYRKARYGEADLVAFLKAYLNVPGSLDYKNGVWSVKPNADDALFELENINDYFKGDFSEIKKAIALQPNNKVKLLFGVKNEDGSLKQRIATRAELIMRNSTTSLDKLVKGLTDARNAGLYQGVKFEICPIKEYDVEPTNLESTTTQAGTTTQATGTTDPFAASAKLPW